jgi:uncharacterized protein YdiU (UPF0061 family)
MENPSPIKFDNSFARMPTQFFSRLDPSPVAQPGPIQVNRALADLLGIDPDWLASPAGTVVIAGNEVPPGAQPLASVYAGHQFGSYNPQLGDGRAILLGEIVGSDGERYDLQLKGSGRTPYSRGGDGRAPLGPVLREYLVSESMHTLGVPTTRALAAVTTGEKVAREQFQPGAVLARVAKSHIRIGSFQFFAARGDRDSLVVLRDHVIRRHYPEAAASANPTLALLQGVVSNQATLVARWQLLGFIHGVMNTDNMLLSGETVDYGPCAFMDAFDPDTVFSSIDHAGRYAYRNQPGIAHWNLACLAQSLLPLLHEDQERAVVMAQEAIDAFQPKFLQAHQQGLQHKLGLAANDSPDQSLVEDLFGLMAREQADYTLTFRHLTDLARPEGTPGAPIADTYAVPAGLREWIERWQALRAQNPGDAIARYQAMRRANPVFIARNHLVQEAITAAIDESDFQPFQQLLERLYQPFDFDPGAARYALPARPEEAVRQTFCGT